MNSLIFYREMNSSVIKTPEALDHLNIPQIGVLPKVVDIKKGYHILQNFLEDSEFYMTFLGPLAFIDADANPIAIVSWQDVQAAWEAS